MFITEHGHQWFVVRAKCEWIADQIVEKLFRQFDYRQRFSLNGRIILFGRWQCARKESNRTFLSIYNITYDKTPPMPIGRIGLQNYGQIRIEMCERYVVHDFRLNLFECCIAVAIPIELCIFLQ